MKGLKQMRDKFDEIILDITSQNPYIGKYGSTLKTIVRKLRDKCDTDNTDSFSHVFNNYEQTHACLVKNSRSDKTLKSNIAQMVGLVKKYLPELQNVVTTEAIKYWNEVIVQLDKDIRVQDPENSSGEDMSWKGLTWQKVVQSKKKLEKGTMERLAMDVYTTPSLPPRRGEWAHVVVYSTDSATRPPEQNWFYLPPTGSKGAFVEFNSFKTKKTLDSQRIKVHGNLVESVRETLLQNNMTPPCNMFGLDHYNAQTQSNKFNQLLMRALNKALSRTDMKRPANLFRHMYLTDMFHNRLANLTDMDVKTTLQQMATSLEQAMYTYRIVEKEEKRANLQSGGGGGIAGLTTKEKLSMLSHLLYSFTP